MLYRAEIDVHSMCCSAVISRSSVVKPLKRRVMRVMSATLQRALPSLLKTLFLCVAVSGFAASGPPSSEASQQGPVDHKASASKVDKPLPNADDEEADSADIPPLARGLIDAGTYLRLRSEQVGIKRGIPDLLRDPGARSRAIRTLERQEAMVRSSQAQARSARISPRTATNLTWTALGPDPIPNGQTIGVEVPVSGRVTAIAVDPTDQQTAYVGTAQGGLYRTQDGGTTWTPLMDSAESLAIGAIAIDPLNRNIVLVGTGEGNFSLDSFFGVGVYIIQNATSPTPTLSGPFNSSGSADVFTGRAITKILVNPSNDDQILVATVSGFSGVGGEVFSTLPTRGVYLSTNALSSAAPTFARLTVQPSTAANLSVTDMVMDPGNANLIVLNIFDSLRLGQNGIWVSTSGNPWAGTATWTRTLANADFTIGKLAVNRSGLPLSTTFFATFDEPATCGGTANGNMSKSTDGGMTWSPIPAASGFCGTQCWYDMVTAILPTDVNTIYRGGSAGGAVGSCVNRALGKSTDGGANFTPDDNSLHADFHALVFAPSNHSVIYAGNDGGIFRSTDGGATWSSLNTAGFNATQFESLSVHPTDPNFMIGGTQDNGTEYMDPSGTWTRADFGDGGFSAIDQGSTGTTSVTMYHTYFNKRNVLVGFARVTNVADATENLWQFFGCKGQTSNNGINCSGSVLFYAPLALGPGNPNTVYFGADHLYRSQDQGATMVAASQAPLAVSSGIALPVSAIGISPQDDNVRMVGLVLGQVFATANGSSSLRDVTGGWGSFYIARAVIDPNDKNTAYVTLDGYGTPTHIWKTTNLTTSLSAMPAKHPNWSAASSGLPDIPVNAFAVDPLNSSYLYAGTDIGVYNSTDGGASWNPYGSGLPRVAVFDLKVQVTSHNLRIATHGRGAWQIAASSFNDTTGLTASASNPGFGTNVTFTARVNKGTGVPIPTGAVTFGEGTTALGTGPLDASGAVTFQTSALTVGTHNITAAYGGDSLYLASTSPALVIAVISDYSLSATTSTATVNAGQPATYTISVNPQPGFNSAVTFTTCSALPQGAHCSFSPNPVTPNGGPVATTLTITTMARTGAAANNPFVFPAGLTAAGLLGIVFLGGISRRKRPWQCAFMLLVACGAIATIASCGGGSTTNTQPPSGTPPGTTNVTVSSTSGSLSHQTTVTLIVK